MVTRVQSKLPEAAVMAHRLQHRLTDFADCRWLDCTTSTNTELLHLARQGAPTVDWPQLLGAHQQTSGKGRLGRVWHNRAGAALMFSCGFKLPWPPAHEQSLRGLGPAIGYTSARCLAAHMTETHDLAVKWPNDLMLGHGKLGGILIETRIKADSQFVVIGLGLNLSGQQQLSSELSREVAGLDSRLDDGVHLSELVAQLAKAWRQTLEQSSQAGFAPFRQGFQAMDYLAGQTIDVWHQQSIVATGTACGLAEDGSLQIQSAGTVQTFSVGDISVRLHQGQS